MAVCSTLCPIFMNQPPIIGSSPEGINFRQIAEDALARYGVQTSRDANNHQRLPADKIELVAKKIRVRLAGFDYSGDLIDPSQDLQDVIDLEAPFADWVNDLHTAVAAAKLDPSLRETVSGLTPQMREVMDGFRDNGGLSSRYPLEKMEYIHKNGLIAMIELEAKAGIHILIGAITSLSRTRWSDANEHRPFSNFGFQDVVTGDEARDRDSLRNLAETSIYVVRSTVVRDMQSAFIARQLEQKRIVLQEELRYAQMQRMGAASRGKGMLYEIAKAQEHRFATAHIGTVRYKNGAEQWDNGPSIGFNAGMKNVGPMRGSAIEFDPVNPSDIHDNASDARLKFSAYMWTLEDGIKALIGPKGTAIMKGHDPSLIKDENDRFITAFNSWLHDRHTTHEHW